MRSRTLVGVAGVGFVHALVWGRGIVVFPVRGRWRRHCSVVRDIRNLKHHCAQLPIVECRSTTRHDRRGDDHNGPPRAAMQREIEQCHGPMISRPSHNSNDSDRARISS